VGSDERRIAAEIARTHRTRPARGPAGKLRHDPVSPERRSGREGLIVGRRALIVTDAVLACLFLLVGIANFTVLDPVSIVGGISSLAVGACAAVTACLFVAFGGWSAKER
jgi:hypothetical protein